MGSGANINGCLAVIMMEFGGGLARGLAVAKIERSGVTFGGLARRRERRRWRTWGYGFDG